MAQPEEAFAGLQHFLGLAAGDRRWLLSDRASPSRSPRLSRWLCFCPACLREDATPYLRRSWRLGFASVCVRHGVILLDRCPACQHACRPFRLDRMRLEEADQAPHQALCWRCLFDLRQAPVVSGDPSVHALEQSVQLAWRRVLALPSNRSPAWGASFAARLAREYTAMACHTLGLPRRFAAAALTPASRHEALVERGHFIAGLMGLQFGRLYDDVVGWVEPPATVVPPGTPDRRSWAPPLPGRRRAPAPAYRPPPALLAWAEAQIRTRLPLRPESRAAARRAIQRLARAVSEER